MADNVTFQTSTATYPPTSLVVSTDEASSGQVQRVKLCLSADGSDTHVSADADGLLVNLGSNNDVTVTSGTVAATQSGTWNVGTVTTVAAVTSITNAVTVQDGGGSLTVDGTVGISGTVAATQSGAWGVTVSGSVAVTDNAGSLTVDAPVAAPVYVRLSDGGSAVDTLPVSLASLPALAAGSNTIGGVNLAQYTPASGRLPVDPSGVTSPVSLASLPALAAGTNNIGDVDVLTQPARAATTDTITAKLATDAIQDGTTALVPKFVAISASSSGNNTILAAVSAKKIRVLRFHLSANGAVNAKFTDGAGGSDLTGLHYLTQYGGIGAAFCPVGLFETTANTALVLNLSSAVAVGGVLTYVEV